MGCDEQHMTSKLSVDAPVVACALRAFVALALAVGAVTSHAQTPRLVSQTGLHYFAVENRDLDPPRVIQRGTAGSLGFAFDRLILAPNTTYRTWILQASTLAVGYTDFTTPSAGRTIEVPDIILGTSLSGDEDGDGLHDDGEFVMGTFLQRPDSDDDGILDVAEVREGTDPLTGTAARTGVIATVDTPGTALDVCAVNDIAVVADGTTGILVFNVFNRMNPTIIAQVRTPGMADAVACSGDLIAVADSMAGLVIVDISDPPAAEIVHEVALGGKVGALGAAGGVAYVGTDAGQLVAVDLASGAVLGRVSVSSRVHDVGVEGDTLFVRLERELHAYSLTGGFLEFLGSVATATFGAEGITKRKRLFVGGGVAYTTSYPGFDSFDVKDPAAMTLLGPLQVTGPNSFKQIVANGELSDVKIHKLFKGPGVVSFRPTVAGDFWQLEPKEFIGSFYQVIDYTQGHGKVVYDYLG